jgi:C-terminal processing protease CtpA/Prc
MAKKKSESGDASATTKKTTRAASDGPVEKEKAPARKGTKSATRTAKKEAKAPESALETAELDRQAQEMRDALREAGRELEEVRGQTREFREALAEARAVVEEVKRLRGEAEGLQGASPQEVVGQAQEELQALVGQVHELGQQGSMLRQMQEAARAQLEGVRKGCEAAQRELEQLQGQIRSTREGAAAARRGEVPAGPGPVQKRLGVQVSQDGVVREVRGGSLAERIGLRGGDKITGVNGRFLGDERELASAVDRVAAGEEVVLAYDRGGERKEVAFRME